MFLETAREHIEDARVLIANRRYPGAVNRTYYPIFYAASAMLLELDLEFDSHYGVRVKYSELFVKTGKVDRRFGNILLRSFDLREDVDYSPESRAAISKEVAEEEIDRAEEFLRMAETFLEGGGRLN